MSPPDRTSDAVIDPASSNTTTTILVEPVSTNGYASSRGASSNGNGKAATATNYVGSLCQLSAPLPTKVALVNSAAEEESPEEEAETESMEQRVLAALAALPTDIDRYMHLRRTRASDEELFFRLLMDHTEEVLPFVYTPTVGEACQRYHELGIVPDGVYLTAADKGRFLEKLRAACPHSGIRVIVVTDGERILGLGDLGAGGMGISEGKILLYTAMAGLDPRRALPVCLDVGTNNERLLADPAYKGLRQKRLRGAEFDALVEELMAAARALKPHVLLQFEDFGNTNAFRLLDRYQPQQCCFNDDIQGTACITLAGLLSALRVTGRPLEDQRIVFLGAGEAGTGIAQLMAQAMHTRCGMPLDEARRRCLFLDSKGLVCAERAARGELQAHKLPFAHNLPPQPDLLSAIHAFRPTVLIGVSAQANAFTREVLQAMAAYNERPVVFPLSNPTSKAECSYSEAFRYTDGRVVFASGSPFPPLVAEAAGVNGGPSTRVTMHPAQANNAYVFGPIGMAALLTRCQRIPAEVFLEAAELLAQLTPQTQIDRGMLFPTLSAMKSLVPLLIARLSAFLVHERLGTPPPAVGAGSVAEWERHVRASMYKPHPCHALASAADAASESEDSDGSSYSSSSVASSSLPSEVHQHPLMPPGTQLSVSAADMAELADMCRDLQQYLMDRRLKENGVAAFVKQEALPASAAAAAATATAGVGATSPSVPVSRSVGVNEMRGVYLTPRDRGSMLQRLQEWEERQKGSMGGSDVDADVDAVLVVDAEVMLGRQASSNGVSASSSPIPLFSSSSSSSWSHLNPRKCLIICLDTGTDDPSLLSSPFLSYRGLRSPRLTGSCYSDAVGELLVAVRTWRPALLLQFADFYNSNAFKLLDKYRGTHCCYESSSSSSSSDSEGEGGSTSSGSESESEGGAVAAEGDGVESSHGWSSSSSDGDARGVALLPPPSPPLVPVCCVSLDGLLSALEKADGVVREFGVAFVEEASKGGAADADAAAADNGAMGAGSSSGSSSAVGQLLLGLDDVKECSIEGGSNDLICIGSLHPSAPLKHPSRHTRQATSSSSSPRPLAIPHSLPYCSPFKQENGACIRLPRHSPVFRATAAAAAPGSLGHAVRASPVAGRLQTAAKLAWM